MTHSLISQDEEIEHVKKAITEQKKQQELEVPKNELYELNIKAKHELNEFQGGLKQADTEKLLKSKTRKKHIADMVVDGFVKMMSPRPVARNLLAIALIGFAVFCLLNFLHIKQLNNFKIYAAYFIEIAAGIQILKSASRSLFIPILATIIGAIAANSMEANQILWMHHQLFFQCLMVTGIIGIAISVCTID